MRSLSTNWCKAHGKWEVRTPKCCNIVELAASFSKMLQIARKMDRIADQKKDKTEKHNCQNNSKPVDQYCQCQPKRQGPRSTHTAIRSTIARCCSHRPSNGTFMWRVSKLFGHSWAVLLFWHTIVLYFILYDAFADPGICCCHYLLFIIGNLACCKWKNWSKNDEKCIVAYLVSKD